jgi:hypothetical protein
MHTTFTTFAAAAALILAAAHVPAVSAQSSRLVIATGLDNPRGLAFGPDNAFYVVEAGRGGNSSVCLPQADAPPTAPARCYGPTGAVTRIFAAGDQRRVVVGLPSLAPPGGSQATGPHDISFGFGAAWLTIGLAGHSAIRGPLEAAGVRLGRLVQIFPNGQWTEVLDLASHELAANPDGGAIDSNPYGLQVLRNRAVFTDAGGNALINIAPTGAMSTLAVFPNRTAANRLRRARSRCSRSPPRLPKHPMGACLWRS